MLRIKELHNCEIVWNGDDATEKVVIAIGECVGEPTGVEEELDNSICFYAKDASEFAELQTKGNKLADFHITKVID